MGDGWARSGGTTSLGVTCSQTDRKILWVWEPEGNTGKSWLAKWLVVNRKACYLQMGKKTDIAHAYKGEEMVAFDLTRSDKDFLNYDVLESLKNGVFFSPKVHPHASDPGGHSSMIQRPSSSSRSSWW